jgi:predicted PurR-regulated permease PerM
MADPLGEPGPPISHRSPFYRGFFGTLGALTAVLLGLFVREAADVLVLVLISALLAIGLQPLVTFGVRRGLRRRWAVLAVAVALLLVLAGVAYVVEGALETQVTNLVNNGPHLVDELRRNRTVARLDDRYHVLSNLEAKLEGSDVPQTVIQGVFDVGVSVLNAVANVVIVFVLTLYMMAGLPQIKQTAYSLAPPSRRDRVTRLGDEILHRVGRYVAGVAVVALIAGSVTLILLLCVGLSEYALPLALLVALLDLVPIVGSIAGAATVSLIGFAVSVPVGIACVVFYLVYEPIEGYVIYPRLMRSSVDVPEYVTIIAVLAGGAVGGIVGALVALPIAATVALLVREVGIRPHEVT